MHPKDDIQLLNLRREVYERLRFVQQRMTETKIEFHLAQGKIHELPKRMIRPPAWALEAARLAWEKGLGLRFKSMSNDEMYKNPRECLHEICGIYEAIRAFVLNPPRDIAEPKVIAEATTKLYKSASRIVAKKVLRHIRKLDTRFERLLPPTTGQQLIEYSGRYKRGVESILTPDGDFKEPASATVEICQVLWLFWPKLEPKPSLTAAFLHKWLGDTVGLYVSIKLVEHIHTELRFASRNQRPLEST